MKISFTKKHFERMKELAFKMLVKNEIIATRLGASLSIVDLMHTQTINTLNGMRLSLSKSIERLENQDEWVASEVQQEQLEVLKERKELVNLIIGWKRYNLELQELKERKAALTLKLKELQEAQKTPEDKIKEVEEQLKDLDSTEEF